MTITQYTQGDLIDFPFTFTTDPTTVTFEFSCGSLGPVTFTYAGSSTPASDTVWRTGTGDYTARVDTTPFNGVLFGAGIGTGPGQNVTTFRAVVAINVASLG